MRILMLAALPEEADAFLPDAGDRLDGDWPLVRRVDTGRHLVHIATTGIGKVNIAAAAARLHALHAADMLMILGTAGKLSALAGDCFWLARAVQHDYGARRPDAFVHYPAGAWPMGPANVTPYAAMPDPGSALPHACIASGDAFIEDGAYAAHLVAALDADIVDMETGALAQYAALCGLPWGGIKATTDDANPDSAGDFHANLRAASRRAALAMERALDLL
ncbi:purine phosphorylase [Sphingobium sp. B12D2B]|uniref:5'-methylthioadenosine/S-adenosylhomocysteine nucleosidase family protein n=1 Tax=Sphingobium sp. B12D2B TaxID=2940577 RepID=UPI0022253C59|nr:purine phosphorylase [Sphingobium sp. B12D2B]MCW2350591.1 adenosylhomocysteine nucleosidase [Sphingobium sp. B12D2B]